MTDSPIEEVLRQVEQSISNANPGGRVKMVPIIPANVKPQDVQVFQNIQPEYPFVSLARQTAEALIEATQRAVNEATGLLERNKAHATSYVADIEKRAEELKNVEERIRVLGNDTLTAHEKYTKNGSST